MVYPSPQSPTLNQSVISTPHFGVLLQHAAFPGLWDLGSELSNLFNLTAQTAQSIEGHFSRLSGAPNGHCLEEDRETSCPGVLFLS